MKLQRITKAFIFTGLQNGKKPFKFANLQNLFIVIIRLCLGTEEALRWQMKKKVT